MDLDEKHLDILKGLSDISRLKIIDSLKNGKLTAGDIENKINKSQSATSQQLKKLVDSKILMSEKEGTKKYFKVRDPLIFDIIQAIDSYSTLTRNIISDSFNIEKKTVFFGLENSGKTSLMLSLVGFSSPIVAHKSTSNFKHISEICDELSITSIDPALFDISEAAGDKLKRKNYCDNPDSYNLLNYENIVYVVDVQDIERYGQSIYYFGDVIDIYRDSELNHNIFIYLHKYDSDLQNRDEFSKDNLDNNLINKLKDLIPSRFEFQIFLSSIRTSNRRELVSFSI